MITSLSLSLLFLDETSFIHLFLHFFLYIFFLVTSRPESYFFLRRFLSSISLLLLLSFFFCFVFLRNVTHLHFPRHVETFFACKLLVSLALALSSACHREPSLSLFAPSKPRGNQPIFSYPQRLIRQQSCTQRLTKLSFAFLPSIN